MQQNTQQKPNLSVHYRSDIGQGRDHNEDCLGYRQPKGPDRRNAGWLYVVADGVGGVEAGEIASKLAVQVLLDAYYGSSRGTPAGRLHQAFAEANRIIHKQSGFTTLVAAAVRDRDLTIANVGDSRAYLIRDGRIRQITRDHTVPAKLVEDGLITPQEAKKHPKRNTLNRSIGGGSQVQVDLFNERLHPGDYVLLCSDGLTKYVADDEMLDMVQRDNLETNVQRLVDLANERGGKDNITVLLVRAAPEPERQALPQGTERRPISLPSIEPWMGMAGAVVALFVCILGIMMGASLVFQVFAPDAAETPTVTTTPTSSATPGNTTTPTPTVTSESTTIQTPTPIPADAPNPEPAATSDISTLPENPAVLTGAIVSGTNVICTWTSDGETNTSAGCTVTVTDIGSDTGALAELVLAIRPDYPTITATTVITVEFFIPIKECTDE